MKILSQSQSKILTFFWGFDNANGQSNLDDNQTLEINENSSKSFEEKITLKTIDLKIKRGEFVAVIGDVGSGKSSLFSSILGQMLYVDDTVISQYKSVVIRNTEKSEEVLSKYLEINEMRKNVSLQADKRVKINGRISFVEQRPFILNTTIRENILFGEELVEDKYNKIVHIWQLGRDLELLDGGDLTEIGERGINLSGGQKARISIARAIYANADIILMDDPLSALDAHVKRKIFEEVWIKELSNKTRILVTHAIDFLDKVDRIIVMDRGKIIHDGSFNDLKEQKYFDNLLSWMGKVNSNDTISSKSDSDKESNDEIGNIVLNLALFIFV